ESYGQRWQVETVMFMLKAHQGDCLTARRPTTQRHELNLMALTHNLLIILRDSMVELFYRAFLTHLPPFSAPVVLLASAVFDVPPPNLPRWGRRKKLDFAGALGLGLPRDGFLRKNLSPRD